jgi:hypothetical protein
VALLIALLLFDPAQTVAGKYIPPDVPVPVPQPLPEDVAALCVLIESGNAAPELFAALGAALLARGDKELAYRAYHRAHRLRPKDAAWGTRMQAQKYKCVRVPDAVIRAEEREAELWRTAWQAHEGDPADFYERYGRPEENMWRVMRARRLSGAAGIVGFLIGALCVGFGRWLPRRAWIVPVLVGAACLAGPQLTGTAGLFFWGAGFAFAGAVFVLFFGRRAT